MCGQNVLMASNLGSVKITTANSALNGTGAMGLVLTAASSPGAGGTIISSVVIKAMGNTTLGMVRLFIDDLSNKFLYKEIMVPANNQTGVVQAFSATVSEPFVLQPGYKLYASTENTENFNVIAKGQDITNCDC